MSEEGGYPAIGDYALIGNCRTAALISKAGALEWLCLPRFDSPSVFASILDREKGGALTVAPTTPFRSSRRYLEDTNVLETTFLTEGGRVRLVDVMPVADEDEKNRALWPDHEVLRLVECVEGEVEIEVACDPRPDYARVMPHLVHRGKLGFLYEHGPHLLALRSEIPLELEPEGRGAVGRATLAAGQRRFISLAYDHGVPGILPRLGAEAAQRIDRSIQWWRRWAAYCRYNGPFRDAVVRSALALKLLTYAPSGAIIAAPTTSLPEKIGGMRNWDYRYCWLRDASLTMRALFELGYATEGAAFLSWLLHSTRLTFPRLQVLYDVYGNTNLDEESLPHLQGYAGSKPVRIGNGAASQLQLDVYGEVIDAAFRFVDHGGRIDSATERVLVGLGKTVCEDWKKKDQGIWETRAPARHHTYSKMMCWVAVDRLIQLHERRHLDIPVDHFRRVRDEIRSAIEERGWDERLGSYTATFGEGGIDASSLQLAQFGFEDAVSPRMQSTFRTIWSHLGSNGLLFRYARLDDGLPEGENAFGVCGFWSVEFKANAGDLDGAEHDFRHLLGFANDVGLFAEEIDPHSGAAIGNFPQAFTHIGLISAALTIAARRGQHEPPGELETRRGAKEPV